MTIKFDIKNLLQIAAIVLIVYIVYTSYQVLLVAIFGSLLAYMLNPAVNKLCGRHIPRVLAVMVMVALSGGLILLLALFLLPQLFNNINDFAQNLPSYVTWVMSRLVLVGERLNVDLSAISLYHYMTQWMSDSGTSVLRWMGGVAGSLQYATAVGANLILLPVITFFLLINYPEVISFMDTYMGNKDKGVRKYIVMFNNVMSSYFRGQFTVVAILCVLYSLALWLVGLDTWILLGISTGLLSIVPYLGFSVGVVISVVMAAVQFQDVWHPIYVVIGYSIVQALESFVITPRVMGSSLGLNPVATIIVLLIGGAVFGIIGMIFALPLAAVIFKIYKDRIKPKEDNLDE
ncbi:MAG: AI-2E family transporter [Deferribacteraceae bacterium]|jgi:predicted PurR-regulated permease PerM|nr:AI-2E family transporter [Deferribacteraceae bacterium]